MSSAPPALMGEFEGIVDGHRDGHGFVLQGRIDVAQNLLTGWNWLSSLPLAAAGLARTDGTRWLVDLFVQ